MWYKSSAPLRIGALWVNFLPSWWHRQYGTSFGRPFYYQPAYRNGVLASCAAAVAARFPALGLRPGQGGPVTQPEFGNAFTPMLAGAEVEFPHNAHPWAHHLPEEKLDALPPVGNLQSGGPCGEIIRQVRAQNTALGTDVKPVFHVRGVLNDALLLRGAELFVDEVEAPERYRRILDYCFAAMQAVIHLNCGVYQNRSRIMLTNCALIMVGPTYYEEKLREYDKRAAALAAAYGAPFAIHHCGLFDSYAESYAGLGADISFLEIGWGSDLALALEKFPAAQVQYIFSDKLLREGTPFQIGAAAQALLAQAGGQAHRVSVTAADLEHGTPDENIMALYKALAGAGV